MFPFEKALLASQTNYSPLIWANKALCDVEKPTDGHVQAQNSKMFCKIQLNYILFNDTMDIPFLWLLVTKSPNWEDTENKDRKTERKH